MHIELNSTVFSGLNLVEDCKMKKDYQLMCFVLLAIICNYGESSNSANPNRNVNAPGESDCVNEPSVAPRLDNDRLQEMVELGKKYIYETPEHGKDIEAFEMFREAAVSGALPEAGYLQAVCFYFGYGVKINRVRAAFWFRWAGEKGHAGAQYNMGVYCTKGRWGVAKDEAAAKEWYTLAASQGHVKAIAWLEKQRSK